MDPIEGIEKSCLEPPQEGGPTKEVGIPEGKVASLQLIEPELAPPNEMDGHVPSPVREHLGSPRPKDIPKQEQVRQDEEKDPHGMGDDPGRLTGHGPMETNDHRTVNPNRRGWGLAPGRIIP